MGRSDDRPRSVRRIDPRRRDKDLRAADLPAPFRVPTVGRRIAFPRTPGSHRDAYHFPVERGRADRAKRNVALTSVGAAIFLTGIKLAVGVGSGSLGLLAEAAQSGVDFVAATLTFLAIRISSREADATHQFGHARFENVSALFQTGLLLATCAWIAWQAVSRLVSGGHHVDPSIWTFAVLVLSITVDWWRSRALSRAARAHGSQALEADALHFSADIWSSLVVLVGLALVWLGDRLGTAPILASADSLAALVVAAIVAVVTARLGWSAVQALVDAAPAGLSEEVADIARSIPGVENVSRVRARRLGAWAFFDLHIAAPRTIAFTQAHAVADQVEDAIKARFGDADIVVHVEPAPSPRETTTDRVHLAARQRGLRVHDVRVREIAEGIEVDLHVELDPALPLARAHAIASELEDAIRAVDRDVHAVNTHLEAPIPGVQARIDITYERPEFVEVVRAIADRVVGAGATHSIRVFVSGAERDVVLHVALDSTIGVEDAHLISARIERALRAEVPLVGSILIHAEPEA
ncbi:MAG: cation-efflux pump [Chloroflexota bacterium]|nr:MAG: cation-efflux pump [Chloroflexota bacterium]